LAAPGGEGEGGEGEGRELDEFDLDFDALEDGEEDEEMAEA
jgi:hypothetical protein